ncbi:hypothetical protein BX666DRAFT_548386 [Dichotomocladium elegans]|nr:hypothetical protein BX666DRAFT_548386 [Dichotomocladium elegans]
MGHVHLKEHDLSIYTANFQESCSILSDKGNSTTVWEGQGLLSWIMNDNSNSAPGDTVVYGRYTDGPDKDHIEVHIELQPTLKWAKTVASMRRRMHRFGIHRVILRPPPYRTAPPPSVSCSRPLTRPPPPNSIAT